MASLGLLAASGMVALGWPAIDLVFTGGRFSAADARLCATYFAIFSVSLFLWSAQAIYCARLLCRRKHLCAHGRQHHRHRVSLPIYALLYHWRGAIGLALASDIGIALQTLTIAVLLHKRRMVSLASLDYAEMGRCLLAALLVAPPPGCCLGPSACLRHLPHMASFIMPAPSSDAAILFAGIAVWTSSQVVLEKAGSALPRVAMRRLGLAEIDRAIEPSLPQPLTANCTLPRKSDH